MELADVEGGAQGGGGAGAQLLDLHLARLVGQGLAGDLAVAVDLLEDVRFGAGGVLPEVRDGLVAVPARANGCPCRRRAAPLGKDKARRLSLYLDVFNVNNQGAASAYTEASGATFGQPSAWVAARTYLISGRLSF